MFPEVELSNNEKSTSNFQATLVSSQILMFWTDDTESKNVWKDQIHFKTTSTSVKWNSIATISNWMWFNIEIENTITKHIVHKWSNKIKFRGGSSRPSGSRLNAANDQTILNCTSGILFKFIFWRSTLWMRIRRSRSAREPFLAQQKSARKQI